jgi:hypothetical protein
MRTRFYLGMGVTRCTYLDPTLGWSLSFFTVMPRTCTLLLWWRLEYFAVLRHFTHLLITPLKYNRRLSKISVLFFHDNVVAIMPIHLC